MEKSNFITHKDIFEKIWNLNLDKVCYNHQQFIIYGMLKGNKQLPSIGLVTSLKNKSLTNHLFNLLECISKDREKYGDIYICIMNNEEIKNIPLDIAYFNPDNILILEDDLDIIKIKDLYNNCKKIKRR